MKLFVWNEPYKIRYGGSIIYAVAETEEAARLAAADSLVKPFGYHDPCADPNPPRTAGLNPAALGPPDRVYEVPAGGAVAECYEWEE